jgi:hypothetical protein
MINARTEPPSQGDPSPSKPKNEIAFHAAFEPDDQDAYRSRAGTRRKMLGLHPVDSSQSPSSRKANRVRRQGVLWSVASVSGLPIALRARDFPDRKSAMMDVRALLERVEELVEVRVADPVETRRGWWMTLDNEVVLVAGRPRRASESENDLRRAVAALQRLAEECVRPDDRRRAGRATGEPRDDDVSE